MRKLTEHIIQLNFTDKKGFDAPMASPRPRFRNAGKFVQTYMPTNYTKHKEYLRNQMTALGIEGPIKVSIEFYFPMLKSWSKKKQAASVDRKSVV